MNPSKETIHLALKKVPYKYITHLCTSVKSSSIFIMDEDGVSYGCISWYNDQDDAIYIDLISVIEEFRRQGLGSQMMEVCINLSIYLGATSINLCVQKESFMHKWYEKIGFIDTIPNKEDDTYIWMNKHLTFVFKRQ